VAFAKPNYVSGEYGNIAATSEEKTITVTGRVTDRLEGEPLPGTSIVIKNSTRGTSSDEKGNFSLSGVKPEEEIVFSFVGYATVVLKAKSKIIVAMERKVVSVEVGNNDAPPPPPADEVAPPPPPPPPADEMASPPPPPPLTGEPVFYVVEEMPQFPGGADALNAYLSKATAGSAEKGKVTVSFSVGGDGKIKNAKVDQSELDKLNKKALEIVYGMPTWKPGLQRGKPVKVEMSLEVQF
jgi:outer membrane biosynthesis protein TonB